MNEPPSVGEISRTVLRIEAKLDQSVLDHESRIRKLERWVYAIPLTVVSAIITAVALILTR